MAAAMETMRNAEDIAKADMKVKLAKVKADARDAAGAARAEMRRRIAAARVQGQASATGGQPVAAAGLATAEVRESARNAHHKAAELAAKFRGQRLALEMFAGCMALSGAIAELGMGLFVPMDNLEGKHPWADIENPNIQQCVLAAIDAGLLWYMHFATPCKLWSLARTTGSSAVPIAVITFTVMALERVAAFNHNASQWQRKPMIVSIENPDRSMLFSVPEIEAVMKKLGMRQVRYSCCAFGASYRKDSVIWTNGPLDPLGRRCEDLPQHTHADTLEGLVSMTGADGKQKTVWKTALSAAYVPDLCRKWAECLRGAAPAEAFGHRVLLEPDWQQWLMQVAGAFTPVLPVPICPPVFVVPWASATATWDRKTPAGKRAAGKRPAAARAKASARKKPARQG